MAVLRCKWKDHRWFFCSLIHLFQKLSTTSVFEAGSLSVRLPTRSRFLRVETCSRGGLLWTRLRMVNCLSMCLRLLLEPAGTDSCSRHDSKRRQKVGHGRQKEDLKQYLEKKESVCKRACTSHCLSHIVTGCRRVAQHQPLIILAL